MAGSPRLVEWGYPYGDDDDGDDDDDVYLYKKLQREGVTKNLYSIRFHTDQPKRHKCKIISMIIPMICLKCVKSFRVDHDLSQ
jgi:hypothetical protein